MCPSVCVKPLRSLRSINSQSVAFSIGLRYHFTRSDLRTSRIGAKEAGRALGGPCCGSAGDGTTGSLRTAVIVPS